MRIGARLKEKHLQQLILDLPRRIWKIKMKIWKKGKQWIQDESGIGVVEVILILVILIGLVVIFKEEIEAIVKNAFESITSGVSEVV